MKQSKLFAKTQKEFPKDEVSKNAQLLIRAGFIYKEMAGVYAFLPLGLKVINKITKIVKDEMDRIGGTQIKTTALQKKEVWEKSDRWDSQDVDVWFKTELRNKTVLGLAFTHEEPLAHMMTNFISSHKDLPIYPYDIRNIFRNEVRAKSGVMRGREFYWKALYSFSKDVDEHNTFYERVKVAYQKIFEKLSIGDITYLTFASGSSFSKYSHEFQTLSEAGEDIIYVDKEKQIAINKEVYTPEVLEDLGLEEDKFIEKKAIEVGNIFSLGDKFSKSFGLKFKDKDEKEKFVIMGSYGIGISRLLGIIVERFNDSKGIIWPEAVAPFKVHLINIGVDIEADKLYNDLSDRGIEVLWDDRENKRPGEKFADADLIGIPYRVVISGKSLDDGGVELKKRNEKEGKIVSEKKLFEILGK